MTAATTEKLETEVARLTETVKGFEKLLTVVLGHRLTREQLTERLDVSGMKQLLMKLRFIQAIVKGEQAEPEE